MEWAFGFKCPFEKQIMSFKMAIRVFKTVVQGIRKSLCSPEEMSPNEGVYDIERVRWDGLEACALIKSFPRDCERKRHLGRGAPAAPQPQDHCGFSSFRL